MDLQSSKHKVPLVGLLVHPRESELPQGMDHQEEQLLTLIEPSAADYLPYLDS